MDGTRRLPISPLIDTYLVPEAPQGARSVPIPPLATTSAIGHRPYWGLLFGGSWGETRGGASAPPQRVPSEPRGPPEAALKGSARRPSDPLRVPRGALKRAPSDPAPTLRRLQEPRVCCGLHRGGGGFTVGGEQSEHSEQPWSWAGSRQALRAVCGCVWGRTCAVWTGRAPTARQPDSERGLGRCGAEGCCGGL